MGDINLDLSKEKRFKFITYAPAFLGALTGISYIGIAATPLAIAGGAAIGAVAGGFALPIAITAGVGLLYTVAKGITGVSKGFSASSRWRAKRLHGKKLQGNMFVHATLKGLKAIKENGKISLGFTALVGINAFKAMFITPVVALKKLVLPKKKRDSKADTKITTPPTIQAKTINSGNIGSEAKKVFKQQPKSSNDNKAINKKKRATKPRIIKD